MSLEASGIELKSGEYDDFRLGNEVLRLFDGQRYLALLERSMIRSEGDNNPFGVRFGIVGACFPVGVQPVKAGKRFQPGKSDALPGFAANAGFVQFVAPIALGEAFLRSGQPNRRRGRGIHLEYRPVVLLRGQVRLLR